MLNTVVLLALSGSRAPMEAVPSSALSFPRTCSVKLNRVVLDHAQDSFVLRKDTVRRKRGCDEHGQLEVSFSEGEHYGKLTLVSKYNLEEEESSKNSLQLEQILSVPVLKKDCKTGSRFQWMQIRGQENK